MIELTQLAIGGYDKNFSYLLSDEGSGEVFVVDPDNLPMIKKAVAEKNYKLAGILVTHSHHDHIAGVEELSDEFKLPIYIHEKALNKLHFGEKGMQRVVAIKDDDNIIIDSCKITVIHTPGHIDDAVCYYIKAGESKDGLPKLISGDTLFIGACGRADLPGSNADDLFLSLQKIMTLPDATLIFPGHDYGETPSSTLGWEKQHNKYLLCETLEEFSRLRLG